MYLASPHETGPLAEHISIDFFVAAICDPNMRKFVMSCDPVNLEEALNHSTRYEALLLGATEKTQAAVLDPASYVYDDKGRRKEPSVRAVEVQQYTKQPDLEKNLATQKTLNNESQRKLAEQQTQLCVCCHEYNLGRTTLVEHKIDTSDARPIKQGLRRQAQMTHTIIDEFTGNMEKQGIIEKSASPWASNVVVVTKSDGTPRITLDYRMLNSVTYKNSYPLPNISDCLDAFKGLSWFGILDLRSSFYKVPLAAVRDKTAFITRRGQWRFCSLPMGLSPTPHGHGPERSHMGVCLGVHRRHSRLRRHI